MVKNGDYSIMVKFCE